MGTSDSFAEDSHGKDPEHFLFIRCGNFQLGAVGRPAIAALVVLVVGIVSTKVLGLW